MNEDEVSKVHNKLLTSTVEEPIKTHVFNDGSVLKVEINRHNEIVRQDRTSGSGYGIVQGRQIVKTVEW